MTDIVNTAQEVLRLDAEATEGPWHGLTIYRALKHLRKIAYYRTAAPALAREVQRLRQEVSRWQRLAQSHSEYIDDLLHPKCDHCKRELELDAEWDSDWELRCCSAEHLEEARREAEA